VPFVALTAVVVVTLVVTDLGCGLGAVGGTSTSRWLEIPLGVATWTSITLRRLHSKPEGGGGGETLA
jgi:hypothetical protein